MLISWARHHGRTQALSELLDMEAVYVYPEVHTPGPRMLATTLRYFISAVTTTKTLARARTERRTVIVVTPPVFPVLIAAAILRSGQMIIDAHSGAFVGERWKWSTPLLRLSSRRARALIVTNREILAKPVACPVIVLHDPFEQWSDQGRTGTSHVLVPLGGGDDEPVGAMVRAAGECSMDFVFCGRSKPKNLPDNASAAGFVTQEEYRDLVSRARVVVGVTDRDFTMQRVGYEAMFAGKAFVTSNFHVLRRFFGDGAVYVSPEDASSIAEGVRQAWQNADMLAENMQTQRALRLTEQTEGLAELRRLVERR